MKKNNSYLYIIYNITIMKQFKITTDKVFSRGGQKLQIITEGIDLSYFNSNPMMLFNHNHDYVVGVWKNINISDGVVLATPDFDDDELSVKIEKKVKRGTLKSASVGIEVLKMDELDGVYRVTQSKLLEASIVSIPANPDATVLHNDNVLLFSNGDAQSDIKQLYKNLNKMAKKEDVKKTDLEILNEKLELSNQEIETLKAEKVEFSVNIDNLTKERDALNKSILELSKEIEDLNTKNDELNGVIELHNKEKFELLLNSAVKDGKLSNENKEQFLELNYDVAKRIINNLPTQTLSLSAELDNKKRSTVVKDYDWYLKNDIDGLKKIANENPSLYKQIENTIK